MNGSVNSFIRKLKEKYLGDFAFYKMILTLALPILIQNGITSFVGLLDNIMVGQLGTEQMSGVAIVNQLINVYNITIFGALSAASIFGAQFYGRGNHDGVRHTFRFKLICCSTLTLLALVLFLTCGSGLVDLFLHDNGDGGDLLTTHSAAMKYLMITLIGLIPYSFTQIYSSTLRETGQTMIPMAASSLAVLINLVLNTLLIFGCLGFPRLGVQGAALATVISRFIEAAIVIVWTHTHKKTYLFIQGAYRSLRIPSSLVRQIITKGIPLLLNETLWSVGQAMLVQCYSTRGLDAVAALNISTTVSNLFNIVFIALGSSISIVVGQLLGAGKLKEAVDTDRKMIFFAVSVCFLVGAVMFALSPLFPRIYKTTPNIRYMASSLIKVSSVFMPLYSFYHASYFTLRTGGKTVITFLFDSCYVWVISIPAAFCLTRFTALSLLAVFILCQAVEIFKAVAGYILLKKKVWVHNIVSDL